MTDADVAAREASLRASLANLESQTALSGSMWIR